MRTAHQRELQRQRSARYHRAHPEKRRAYNASYYAANKDKYAAYAASRREADPEGARSAVAGWKRANPEKVNARNAARRASRRNAPGRGVTPEQWQEILDASLGICAYCNEHATLTMDHIEPLSLGGDHDVDNVAAVCSTCNASKGDTPLLLWLAKRANLRALLAA